MKARRHLHLATDPGDPVLGYEAATPHLTLPPPGDPPPRRSQHSGLRARGLVSSPLVLGALLGLCTTSVALLALLA
jgi:hypothetical protein